MHTPTNHRHKSKQRLVSFIIPICWWCNFLIWLYSCAKLMCQAVTSQRNCTFTVCAYHRLFTPSWTPPWPPCSLTRNKQLSCQSCRKGKLLAVRNLGGPKQRPLCGIIYPSTHLSFEGITYKSRHPSANKRVFKSYRSLSHQQSSLNDYIQETAQISINVNTVRKNDFQVIMQPHANTVGYICLSRRWRKLYYYIQIWQYNCICMTVQSLNYKHAVLFQAKQSFPHCVF